MAVEDNGMIVRSLFDAINSKDLGKMQSLTAANCHWHDVPTGATLDGPDAVRNACAAWINAFPDAKVEVTNLLTSGRYVFVEYQGRGTHRGPLVGPSGTIPPTNRKGELLLCDVYELENGKFVNVRSYYDLATLLRQLGVMPQIGTRPTPETGARA